MVRNKKFEVQLKYSTLKETITRQISIIGNMKRGEGVEGDNRLD